MFNVNSNIFRKVQITKMSLIEPDFFSFLKKLEENGDKLTSGTPLEEPLEFEYDV